MVHVTDGIRIDIARSAPSVGHTVREKLIGEIIGNPSETAGGADETPSTTDHEGVRTDPFQLTLYIGNGHDGEQTAFIELIRRSFIGNDQTRVGIGFVKGFHQRDDPFEDGLSFVWNFYGFLITIEILPIDIPDEVPFACTFSETKDEGSISPGLPRDGGIQPYESRISDEVEIR
jgi:hypothetical protein